MHIYIHPTALKPVQVARLEAQTKRVAVVVRKHRVELVKPLGYSQPTGPFGGAAA